MPHIHEAVPVTAGLALGVAIIIIFSTLHYQSPSRNNRIIESSRLSTVIIPEGASSFNANFEPEIIKVVLGVNNTVKWENQDVTSYSVIASSNDDPLFYAATKEQCENNDYYNNCRVIPGKNHLLPGGTFEYTFTKEGVFDYYSVPHPWMRGTVVVFGPSMVDNISKSLIEERLRQKIEGIPLTVYVGNTDRDVVKPLHDGALSLYAIQGFVIDNPMNLINAYQINPNWEGGNGTADIFRASETNDVLKDGNGNSIVHNTIFSNDTDNTLSTFDAVCPSNNVTFGADGTISQTGTNKETTISYGSQVPLSLDNNASGIMFYGYSLGEMEPIAYGFYRLTFLSPFEASIMLSDELDIISYERSNCMIFGGPEDGTALPYYDIIFELDEKGVK